jgi:hypothetical protein
MEQLDSKYAFRREMVDRLKEDLFGPGSRNEIIDERPLERYVTGILWPAADETVDEVPDDPESVAAASGETQPDSPVANSRLAFPSSIGITVAVDTSRDNILVIKPHAASYLPMEEAAPASAKPLASPNWRRVELEEVEIRLPLTAGTSTRRISEGLELYALVRSPKDGITSVTVVLRNRKPKPPAGVDRDTACWFQAGLTVESLGYGLTDRSKLRTSVSSDEDLASAELMYRNHMVFAAGHGCAVETLDNSIIGGHCRRVATTFVPTVDVNRSKAGRSSANLSLGFLGSASRDDVLEQLGELSSDYEAWIRKTAASIDDPAESVPPHLGGVARDHVADAYEALARIRKGIDELRVSDESFEAFQLANKAMHMQRSRQDWVRAGRSEGFELDDKQAWRPFQLAFILINLPSVTEETHPERNFADLLWFPTGGGKTEAYLGLIAYLILLRRLRDPGAKGVAVIMRYTLRLLTIQQFERAAMLICSLEAVRLASPARLGNESFSIGLWVGSGATPNNIRDAKANLNKLMRGDNVVEGNPCQIEACPWCGSRLRPENYVIFRAPTDRMKILCPNRDCEFRDGLPLHIVDTDVYRERPELIIGTVDKFARMAWNGEISTLFGRLNESDQGPGLIIQDELHLISGPLGSTVGLFETAVDLAASGRLRNDDHSHAQRGPKIIASTATIRRAEDQIKAVFNRESRLFPPPGLGPDDSFYSEKALADELGTRQYVGVMAAGTSHATLMVRTYASLLHSAMAIEGSDEDRDPYWTLIGYFNSLRVLGSAYLQVYDDVAARLRLLAHREGLEMSREVQLSELTSRVANNLIPAALKALEKPLGGPLTPEDVVLATNMISVGLDVDRLGLMAVMGQPQSSAEYIQATSRVGRKHPGLVVTIFNSAKTRDRSHFEGFADFHGALYRGVEATSATPFAARSRDRALHAVFISALRMLAPAMRSNDGASSARDASIVIDQVRDIILDRVKIVDERELAATSNELETLMATWRTAINNNDHLVYEDRKNPHAALLVNSTDALDDPEFIYSTSSVPWPTPSSMRDVDAETTLRPSPMRKSATESGFKRKETNN